MKPDGIIAAAPDFRLRFSFLTLAALLVLPLQLCAAAAPETPPPRHISAQDAAARLEKMRDAQELFPYDGKRKRTLAEAYAVYGAALLKNRQYEEADEQFVRALELYPEESDFTLLHGICSYRLKKYDAARYELERARELMPDSVETLYYLGLVLYETDSPLQAVGVWEQALQLAPGHAEITRLLEKSRREIAVEADMDRRHSSRFDLTYDPGVTAGTARMILDVLEEAVNRIGSELGHFPQARVPVSIYRREDFKTVTASPDWSGGVYDGTIRLPFGTVTEITPPLRAVLFHEYAHVVVYDLTRGNCPVWLNEGIAELFGRGQFSHPRTEAADKTAAVSLDHIRTMEGSFSGLSARDASRAYDQSRSLVGYIVKVYGWHRVSAILRELGKNRSIETAIAVALQDYSLTYEDLVREWQEAPS